MSPSFLLLLLSLASYRITRFIVRDSLPERPRNWWFLRYPPDQEWLKIHNMGRDRDGRVPQMKPSKLGQLIDCPWCIGFWISAAVAALAWRLRPLPLPGLWPWAISGIVGLLFVGIDRESDG